MYAWAPNGLELSCPAEAGRTPVILAHPGGRAALHHPLARRVSFSELLGRLQVAGMAETHGLLRVKQSAKSS